MWDSTQIIDLLETSDRAVERAVIFLHESKAVDEKHASIVAYWYGWVMGLDRNGDQRYSPRSMTGRHLARARKMALQYVEALVAESNRKGSAKASEKASETPEKGPRWLEDCECCIYIGRYKGHDLYYPATGDSAVARYGAKDYEVSAVGRDIFGWANVEWLAAWKKAVKGHQKRLDKAQKVWALYQDQKELPEGATALRIFKNFKATIAEAS